MRDDANDCYNEVQCFNKDFIYYYYCLRNSTAESKFRSLKTFVFDEYMYY